MINKKNIIIIVFGFLGLIFVGCRGIEGIYGKEYDEYIASMKPALYYWNKDRVTRQQRRDDAVTCGSTRMIISPNSPCVIQKRSCEDHLDNMPNFFGQIEKARKPYETEYETEKRLYNNWANCMRGKGYKNLRD